MTFVRSLLIAHNSLLITQNLRSSVASVSFVCHWKFFTKTHFCINPVGMSKMPSWKIFISQLENYFFSVGKSKFRSRAILGGFLGLFLNYFWWFLFILKPICDLQAKVKMFDIEWWVVSNEPWVFSTVEQKNILGDELWATSGEGWEGRDVACSVRRVHKSYNLTRIPRILRNLL